MITYLCVGFSSLASLVLCFSPPEVKVWPEAIEMRGVWRLPHQLDWETKGVVRDVEGWLVMMMSRWWERDCGLGLEKIYTLLIIDAFLHSLRMQTTAKLLASPDPFIFYFPLKFIGADHGLHTSGGVQISWLAMMIEIGSWFRSTLKDVFGWEFAKLRFYDRITVLCLLLAVSKIL